MSNKTNFTNRSFSGTSAHLGDTRNLLASHIRCLEAIDSLQDGNNGTVNLGKQNENRLRFAKKVPMLHSGVVQLDKQKKETDEPPYEEIYNEAVSSSEESKKGSIDENYLAEHGVSKIEDGKDGISYRYCFYDVVNTTKPLSRLNDLGLIEAKSNQYKDVTLTKYGQKIVNDGGKNSVRAGNEVTWGQRRTFTRALLENRTEPGKPNIIKQALDGLITSNNEGNNDREVTINQMADKISQSKTGHKDDKYIDDARILFQHLRQTPWFTTYGAGKKGSTPLTLQLDPFADEEEVLAWLDDDDNEVSVSPSTIEDKLQKMHTYLNNQYDGIVEDVLDQGYTRQLIAETFNGNAKKVIDFIKNGDDEALKQIVEQSTNNEELYWQVSNLQHHYQMHLNYDYVQTSHGLELMDQILNGPPQQDSNKAGEGLADYYEDGAGGIEFKHLREIIRKANSPKGPNPFDQLDDRFMTKKGPLLLEVMAGYAVQSLINADDSVHIDTNTRRPESGMEFLGSMYAPKGVADHVFWEAFEKQEGVQLLTAEATAVDDEQGWSTLGQEFEEVSRHLKTELGRRLDWSGDDVESNNEGLEQSSAASFLLAPKVKENESLKEWANRNIEQRKKSGTPFLTTPIDSELLFEFAKIEGATFSDFQKILQCTMKLTHLYSTDGGKLTASEAYDWYKNCLEKSIQSYKEKGAPDNIMNNIEVSLPPSRNSKRDEVVLDDLFDADMKPITYKAVWDKLLSEYDIKTINSSYMQDEANNAALALRDAFKEVSDKNDSNYQTIINDSLEANVTPYGFKKLIEEEIGYKEIREHALSRKADDESFEAAHSYLEAMKQGWNNVECTYTFRVSDNERSLEAELDQWSMWAKQEEGVTDTQKEVLSDIADFSCPPERFKEAVAALGGEKAGNFILTLLTHSTKKDFYRTTLANCDYERLPDVLNMLEHDDKQKVTSQYKNTNDQINKEVQAGNIQEQINEEKQYWLSLDTPFCVVDTVDNNHGKQEMKQGVLNKLKNKGLITDDADYADAVKLSQDYKWWSQGAPNSRLARFAYYLKQNDDTLDITINTNKPSEIWTCIMEHYTLDTFYAQAARFMNDKVRSLSQVDTLDGHFDDLAQLDRDDLIIIYDRLRTLYEQNEDMVYQEITTFLNNQDNFAGLVQELHDLRNEYNTSTALNVFQARLATTPFADGAPTTLDDVFQLLAEQKNKYTDNTTKEKVT